MTEPRHDGLDQAIRDHIAEYAEMYADAGHALLAVLDVHPYNEDGRHCEQCIDPDDDSLFIRYPCPTVEKIAEQLGIIDADAEAITAEIFANPAARRLIEDVRESDEYPNTEPWN